MRLIVRKFDRFLRRTQGVFEYWEDPDCMFRAQIAKADHPIHLPDSEIPAGARVLVLHFWNEHMPRIPPDGASLAEAVRGQCMLVTSLRVLAPQIRREARYVGVQSVGGVTVLFSPGDGSAAEKLFVRLGFSMFPYHIRLGSFGEFWENLYTWGLVWAFNASSLRQRSFFQLRRTEVWMFIEEFMRRYEVAARSEQGQ